MITLQEEIQLIDRILAGERDLYAKLVDKYKSYAYTIALKIVENRPEAEEAAQDAFEEAANILIGNYVSKVNDVLKDNEIRLAPPGMISGTKIRVLNTKLKSFKITAKTRIGDLEMSIGFAGRQS